eukprot:g11487.t1
MGWDIDAALSDWRGVAVDDEGRVVKLYGYEYLEGPISNEIGALSKLKVLTLSDTKLTGPIPPELGNLKALEELDLSRNQLSGAIPAQLSALVKLRLLNLCSNQLSGSIPKELGGLPELMSLGLSDNKLTSFWDHSSSDVSSADEPHQGYAGVSVPKQLGELLALLSRLFEKRHIRSHHVTISNNPWKEPPEAVVKNGMPAVSRYFVDLFAEGAAPVPRRMIKVVLVGQGGAGKTSLRQSIRNRRPTPTSGSEESTVQIDVEEIEMDVDNVSLRVYDCAGQVAYTGLLQMFFSPRAVSLLVCNTGVFRHRDGCSNETDIPQLKKDLRKLQEMRVCDWLRSLSFRVPDSDVVIVGTKCDLAGGAAADLAERMDSAIRAWLQHWRCSGMTAARVEDGVSLTSCAPTVALQEEGTALGKRTKPEASMWACDWREDIRDDSLPSLLHRIMYNSTGELRGAAMVLPRSWNIALEVLNAFGNGRDPVESVHQMELRADGQEGGKELGSTRVKEHKGITLAELSAKWNDVVELLERDGVNVVNPDHALEGALSIREYEGSIVRHEKYVFLDVTWLATILKPLLNHRDGEDPFSGSVVLGDTGITLDTDEHIASWKRLKNNGVLEPALARALWPNGLSDYVLSTLVSLGLTHPLDGDSADGLVVLLRLGKERPRGVGKELDDFRRDHKAVLSVTWKVYMGVPPGAIEKVLTRCCGIGKLRTFWRFGVLIQGGFGAVAAVKTFALVIEYSHDKTELDMKVYGDIRTAAPWAALSLGVSVVRTVCLEFPGLRWRAYLQCPQHDEDMQISNTATEPGDKVLCGETCSLCDPETGGLGAAATDLLEVIDVNQSRDNIFHHVNRRFVALWQRHPVLRPELSTQASRDLHPQQDQRRFEHWLKGIKEELQGLLHRPKESTKDEGVGDNARAGGGGDFSGVFQEMAQLRRLVGDVQSQLEKQHQDVRGWFGTKDNRFAHGVDSDDGVMGRLDFVVSMLMAVVCSTLAAMAVAPVSGANATVETAVSSAMEGFESLLETQLSRLTLDESGEDVDVKVKASNLERGAYAHLREFIHGVEDTARMDIAKTGRGRRAGAHSSKFVFFGQEMVQVQRHAGDAAVQWVLKGQENAWIDAMKSAPSA